MPLRHRLSRYLLALPGSIAFCLRYLPLRQAVRLPILIARPFSRTHMGGSVRIEGPVRPGMIKIGFGWASLFDWRRERGVWVAPGEVVFEGPAEIFHGARLSIEGRLVLGANVNLSSDCRINCMREISIGADTKISWSTLVMDSDLHAIDGRDPHAPVSIGEHVLIGANAIVLKGVRVPDGVIVAAGSCLTRSTAIAPRELVAGNPARVVRSGVSWER